MAILSCMESSKIKKFMQLAGQKFTTPDQADSKLKALAAQLLLSETLEYVVKGLGVTPKVNGQAISDPNGLEYEVTSDFDQIEMLDGLADVAYTMYWNMEALGLKLEEAFELVCDNNLEKFVLLEDWQRAAGEIDASEWDLGKTIAWPNEVVKVEVIQVGKEFYGVGKDANGKVRKPSTYRSVDLSGLVE